MRGKRYIYIYGDECQGENIKSAVSYVLKQLMMSHYWKSHVVSKAVLHYLMTPVCQISLVSSFDVHVAVSLCSTLALQYLRAYLFPISIRCPLFWNLNLIDDDKTETPGVDDDDDV